MKEVFVLVETFNGKSVILDRCFASSIEKAQSIFDGDGWVIGEAMSEADFWRNAHKEFMEEYEEYSCFDGSYKSL